MEPATVGVTSMGGLKQAQVWTGLALYHTHAYPEGNFGAQGVAMSDHNVFIVAPRPTVQLHTSTVHVQAAEEGRVKARHN